MSSMIWMIISVIFLPMILATLDPTKVCAPDQVSFFSYNIQTDVISLVVMDFKQKLVGIRTGNRTVVEDLSAAKSYATDESGNCWSSDLPVGDLYPQCLPADAEYLGEIYLGLVPTSLPITGWQFPYLGGKVKVAFSNEPNQPSFPILSRFVNDKGVVSATFHVDVVKNITQPDLLKISDPCPPLTIG